MKTTIKNGVIVALSVMVLAGCSTSTNTSSTTSVAASITSEETIEEKVLTADDVETALQGAWDAPNGTGTFTFTNGTLTIESQGSSLSGSYEIDTEGSQINASLDASNGTVQIAIPYTYDDTLKIYNNNQEELTKK